MVASPDWGSMLEQAAQAGGDRAPGLKAALPLAYVLERWNVPVAADGDELVAPCLFHDDSNPSLRLYRKEDGERYKCFACGAGGDLFDLLARLAAPEGFGATLDLAETLLAEMREADWKGPELGVKRPFDFDQARQYVDAAEVTAPDAVFSLLNGKPGWLGLAEVDVMELIETWRLGSAGDWAVLPYFRRDGSLVTYKRRKADTPAMSAPGSDFSDVLYGEWLDSDTSRPVVLTEGESDAWAAWDAVGATHAVLSLPTGAGAHPKPGQVAGLKGRTVTIAFDGDDAGRAGALRWTEALLRADATVLVASLGEGEDLAGLVRPGDAIRAARPLVRRPSTIVLADGVWARPGPKDTNVELGNWSFVPERELRGDGVVAYEGLVLPWGDRTVLKSTHLETATKLNAWAVAHGGTFTGSDKDARSIQQFLQAQGPFLPQGAMTTVAGLYRGEFVWPGGKLGTTQVTYVPPASDIHLEKQMEGLLGGDWDPALPARLRQLHRRDVMDPILAWLAIAPFRSMVREFPVLAVTGSSGSGKTTLLETVLRAFTGTLITVNLTSTTPHAMFAYVGATNGFPVWVDEYRPGAREETRKAFEQVLRDAYTGQASAKGGMGERWAEVRALPALAPLIVSGEDAFRERSHVERMVPIPLPREGRSPAVLQRILAAGLDTGFAQAYLGWLLEQGVPEQQVVTSYAGPEDLPPRMRANLGVLYRGWDMLNGFTRPFGVDLGEPDFSLVIGQSRNDMSADPLRDAVLWLRGVPEAEAVWEADGLLYVSPEALVGYVNRHPGVIALPGGVEAIRRLLADEPYMARRTKTARFGGGQRRAWSFPASVVDADEVG